MAERGSREGSTRRQSFRKSLADAALPDDYLEALEQKRKQLDESIHKYIAAKERDYKSFEKELRQKHSHTHDKTRRTNSEFTPTSATRPRTLEQQQNATADVLLSAGLKPEHIGQPLAVALKEGGHGVPSIVETKAIAGLTDRRASVDRNKEFVGVFTPAFLPALEDESPRNIERVGSAPPSSTSSNRTTMATPNVGHGMQRANSDSLAESKQKRPAHLQLAHRTSSSGSSVDGRLTSAMKSPTHPNPKRKRVSLAVGDYIVAPSDSVPLSMDIHSTPSHSRTRSLAVMPSQSDLQKPIELLRDIQTQEVKSALSLQLTQDGLNGNIARAGGKPKEDKTINPEFNNAEVMPNVTPAAPIVPTAPSSKKSRPKIDPDGDLFDFEEEDDSLITSDVLESDDEITGRLDMRAPDNEIYDPNAGLEPEPNSSVDDTDSVDFVPGSANASKQPTEPGFRRPSVSFDPMYVGDNYEKAEHSAVVNDVYGSSFARPTKGSFTAGSLGESFMAKNAEMLRNRGSQESAQIHS